MNMLFFATKSKKPEHVWLIIEAYTMGKLSLQTIEYVGFWYVDITMYRSWF